MTVLMAQLRPGSAVQQRYTRTAACTCPTRCSIRSTHTPLLPGQLQTVKSVCKSRHVFVQTIQPLVCKRTRNVLRAASSTSSATGSVLRKGTVSEVRWGTFVSESFSLERAIDEAVDGILLSLGEDTKPEIAMVFVSSKHAKFFGNVIPYLRQKLPSLRYIFGCSGYGVLGGAASGPKEVVDDYGVSLSLGSLPGVSITLTHTLRSAIPSEDAAPEAWASFVGLPDARDKNTSFFILCDHSFQHWDRIVQGLDYAYQSSKTLGGQLSLGSKNRSRALFCWSAEAEARVTEAKRAAKEAREASENGENGGEGGGGWLSKLASFIGVNGDDDSDGIDEFPVRGLYQYGAIIMGIQGDVTFDILPHEGFAFMTDKTYVVDEAYGNVIISVREEGAPLNKRMTPCEMLVEALEPTIRKRVAEKENDENIYGVLHEVFPDIAVAVAPSSTTLNRENVELEDFSLLGVSGVDSEMGHMEVMSINNQQISAGQRLRLVTVDSEAVTDDLRQRMLSYKRRELQDVMSGRALSPAFGALLLSNQAYTKEEGSESTSTDTVFNFMPVPTSGVLLSNQFATDKINVTKTTHAGVLAIMRAGGRQTSLAEVTDVPESKEADPANDEKNGEKNDAKGDEKNGEKNGEKGDEKSV